MSEQGNAFKGNSIGMQNTFSFKQIRYTKAYNVLDFMPFSGVISTELCCH